MYANVKLQEHQVLEVPHLQTGIIRLKIREREQKVVVMNKKEQEQIFLEIMQEIVKLNKRVPLFALCEEVDLKFLGIKKASTNNCRGFFVLVYIFSDEHALQLLLVQQQQLYLLLL